MAAAGPVPVAGSTEASAATPPDVAKTLKQLKLVQWLNPLLAGGIVVSSDVFTWHLPALVVLTALAAYLLSTGRLTRWHGCILLALYVVYWVVSLVAFGEVPVEMD